MKRMIYSDKRKEEILEQGCYKGYKYVILNLGTHPTAYVENKLHVNSYADDKLTDINVHGGFTYLGQRLFHCGDATEYIGWDYAHYDDFCGFAPEVGGKRWATEEIQKDVFMVIDQLAEQQA